jgi:4-amino-4-deoxy-L-arabinose transferase-like glycosyltransferase
LALIVLAVTAVRITTLAADPIPLSVDEAQYWIWSRTPDFGYFSKPPLIAWIIGATTTYCGDGEACVRLGAPLIHATTALAVYALATALRGPMVAWWSALTYTFIPGVSVSARIMSTDVPLLLCWTLALICLVRARDSGRWGWWIGLGLAVGVGFLSKYAMALFLMCAILYALSSPVARRRFSASGLALAAGVATLVLLPNVVWNAQWGFPSVAHAATNLSSSGAGVDVVRALAFVGAQFAVFGPLTFAVLLAVGLARVFARRAAAIDDTDRLLLAFSLPIIVAVAIEGLIARAYANWAAPAYIAATIFAVHWMLALRPFLLRATLALHLVAAVAVSSLGVALTAFDLALPAGLDPAARERGWDGVGPWLEALHRRYPEAVFLFDDRPTMAAAIYYTRPLLDRAVMWNSRGGVRNHFELTTDPTRNIGRDFIYVTRHGSLDRVVESVGRAAPLATWTRQTHRDRCLTLYAARLEGFRGYRP